MNVLMLIALILFVVAAVMSRKSPPTWLMAAGLAFVAAAHSGLPYFSS